MLVTAHGGFFSVPEWLLTNSIYTVKYEYIEDENWKVLKACSQAHVLVSGILLEQDRLSSAITSDI